MTGRTSQELELIIELQAIELKRHVRDNQRLNQRVDRLLDEVAGLQQMQRQEQILREKEQALRHQTQKTINDLLGKIALPAPQTIQDHDYRAAQQNGGHVVFPVLIEESGPPPTNAPHSDETQLPDAPRESEAAKMPHRSDHPDIPGFLKDGERGAPVNAMSRATTSAQAARHHADAFPPPEHRPPRARGGENGDKAHGVFGRWSEIFSIGQ